VGRVPGGWSRNEEACIAITDQGIERLVADSTLINVVQDSCPGIRIQLSVQRAHESLEIASAHAYPTDPRMNPQVLPFTTLMSRPVSLDAQQGTAVRVSPACRKSAERHIDTDTSITCPDGCIPDEATISAPNRTVAMRSGDKMQSNS
jgi:hypothetical protein